MAGHQSYLLNQSISIKNFGPIKDCCININGIVFISGNEQEKKAIAKCITFFRCFKSAIALFVSKRKDRNHVSIQEIRGLGNYHMQCTFGRNWFNPDMEIVYNYGKCKIKVTKRKIEERAKAAKPAPKEIEGRLVERLLCFEIDRPIVELLRNYASPGRHNYPLSPEDTENFDIELSHVMGMIPFNATLFLPENKSSLAEYWVLQERQILAQTQLSFHDFVAHVRRSGRRDLDAKDGLSSDWLDRRKLIEDFSEKMLGGIYDRKNGSDVIRRKDGSCCNINDASQEQKEALWIVNTLHFFTASVSYGLYLILEEPDKDLSVESKFNLTNMLALFSNMMHTCIITSNSEEIEQQLVSLVICGMMPFETMLNIKELKNKYCATHEAWLAKNQVNFCRVIDGVCKKLDDKQMRELMKKYKPEIM